MNFRLRRSGPPITSVEIAALCTFSCIQLPDDYTKWLIQQNGGIAIDDLLFEDSIGSKLKVLRFFRLLPDREEGLYHYLAEFIEDFSKPDLFPFGLDQEFSWLFISLRTKDFGSVVRLVDYPVDDPSVSPREIFVARSFREFIGGIKLHEKETDLIVELANTEFSEEIELSIKSEEFACMLSINGHNLGQEACKCGNLRLVREWAFNGLSLSGCLRLAAINKRAEVVEFLVQNGGDINEVDRYGRTPVDYARDENTRNAFLKHEN